MSKFEKMAGISSIVYAKKVMIKCFPNFPSKQRHLSILTSLMESWPQLFERWITLSTGEIDHYPVDSVVCFVSTYPPG